MYWMWDWTAAVRRKLVKFEWVKAWAMVSLVVVPWLATEIPEILLVSSSVRGIVGSPCAIPDIIDYFSDAMDVCYIVTRCSSVVPEDLRVQVVPNSRVQLPCCSQFLMITICDFNDVCTD